MAPPREREGGRRRHVDCGPTTAPFDCRWAEDAGSPTDRDLCSLRWSASLGVS